MLRSKMTIITFLVMCSMILTQSCSDTGSSNMTLTMRPTGSGLSKSTASNDVMTIDTAKILITRVMLHSEANDSLKVESNPVVVYLNLTGSAQTVATANVPQGSYNRVKFEIHLPAQNESVPDQEFRTGANGNERFSIIVKGTFNGTAFVFKSRDVINQSVTIDPPLEVADSIGTANATLTVDVNTWFTLGLGGLLDPTDTSASNVAMINNNIRASFRAFRDNDNDGNED